MEVVDINPNSNNQGKIPGNTLDFYNEGMSRKAVEKLFDETPHENNAASNYTDMDDNYGAYRRPSPQQEQFAPRPQIARNSNGYPDFNAQRSEPKGRASYDGAGHDDRDRKRNPADSGRYRKIPDLPNNPNPRTQQGSPQATSKIATVPRSVPGGSPRPPSEGRKYVANDNKFIDTEIMDDGTQKILKYVFAGVLFVLVLILFLLLLRINGLNGQITDLRNRFEAIESDIESATALTIRLEGLDLDIGNLRTQVTEMVTPPAFPNDHGSDNEGGQATGETSDSQDTTTPTDAPPTGGGTAATGVQTHVVQSGDTLSSVAQRFYGASNPTLWALIREANGMTSDALRVGDTITIPQRQ